jgi:DNA-binding PadR family transcriptional regulator
MKKCACKGMFLDKFIQPAILSLLYIENLHGFSILKKLEEKSIIMRGSIDPTGLYRTLKKMEDSGILTSYWDTENTNYQKRIYQITDDGRDCIFSWKETLQNYRKSLDELIKNMPK